MTVTPNWIAIPEMLYIIVSIASMVLCVLSLIFMVVGLRKKKSKKYFISWFSAFAVSSFVMYLIMVAHFIVANTMIGG